MQPKTVLLLSVFGFTACATESVPPGDWIDVPLAPATYFEHASVYQEGTYQIPVPANSDLEHKISMNEGDIVVYSWSVAMADPQLLTAEFHGHTERVGDAPGTVMFYKVHTDGKESGSLKAPFTGIHGWYLNNESAEDIVVELKVAGFYTE